MAEILSTDSNGKTSEVQAEELSKNLNEMATEVAGEKLEFINAKDVESKSFLKRILELPSKAKNKLNQVQEIIRTYRQLRAELDEAMTTSELDEQLDAFRGFHHDLKDSHFSRRTWKNFDISKVKKEEIVGIDPEVYAQVARFAMEVEAPTIPYSYTTGESLSNLFPKIGRFMGKDVSQQKYSQEKNIRACESAWCAEEERHAGFLAQIVHRITGEMPSLDNANVADSNARDEKSAMKHLAERQTYEWNATSAYTFLMVHSTGYLREAMRNILRDEVKHLTIMSSAYTYIYGFRPWKRFMGIINNSLEIRKKHDGKRTDTQSLQSNKMAMIKMVLTHLIVEAKMRKYLRTLPHHVLQKYFDSPSDLPQLGQSGLSEADKLEIENTRESYKQRRYKLAWWKPSEAQETLKRLSFAETHKAIIERIVQQEFSGFHEALTPESPGTLIMNSQMALFVKNKKYRDYFPSYIEDKVIARYLPRILYDQLREHQLRNNRYEINKNLKSDGKTGSDSGEVNSQKSNKTNAAPELINIAPSKGKEAQVLEFRKVSENFALVRVEKPPGLVVEAGSSVSLGIEVDSQFDSRVLSVANSPRQNYLEFAVRTSNSDFKKNFFRLKAGDRIYLKVQKHKLAFDFNAPMVMIAAGIGITPFRSAIQFVNDMKMKTPMWLLYGNRDEIPFESEINEHAQSMQQFNLQQTLTKPGADWTGRKGRIDEQMLSQTVQSAPADAKYYIVGSPDMIQDTLANLKKIGVPESQIIVEAFFSNAATNKSNDNKKEMKEKLKDEELICVCKRVTTGQIRLLVEAGKTLEEIKSCTGAGAGCGGCLPKLGMVVKCFK